MQSMDLIRYFTVSRVAGVGERGTVTLAGQTGKTRVRLVPTPLEGACQERRSSWRRPRQVSSYDMIGRARDYFYDDRTTRRCTYNHGDADGAPSAIALDYMLRHAESSDAYLGS